VPFINCSLFYSNTISLSSCYFRKCFFHFLEKVITFSSLHRREKKALFLVSPSLFGFTVGSPSLTQPKPSPHTPSPYNASHQSNRLSGLLLSCAGSLSPNWSCKASPWSCPLSITLSPPLLFYFSLNSHTSFNLKFSLLFLPLWRFTSIIDHFPLRHQRTSTNDHSLGRIWILSASPILKPYTWLSLFLTQKNHLGWSLKLMASSYRLEY
jgi:hypothetical protein